MAERSGRNDLPVLDGCLALLDLGHAVMHSHELLGRPDISNGERRALETALGRLQHVASAPERSCATLRLVARRLSGPDAAIFTQAADALSAQAAFLSGASGSSMVPALSGDGNLGDDGAHTRQDRH